METIIICTIINIVILFWIIKQRKTPLLIFAKNYENLLKHEYLLKNRIDIDMLDYNAININYLKKSLILKDFLMVYTKLNIIETQIKFHEYEDALFGCRNLINETDDLIVLKQLATYIDLLFSKKNIQHNEIDNINNQSDISPCYKKAMRLGYIYALYGISKNKNPYQEVYSPTNKITFAKGYLNKFNDTYDEHLTKGSQL